MTEENLKKISKEEWRKAMGNVYRGVPVGPLIKKALKPYHKLYLRYGEEVTMKTVRKNILIANNNGMPLSFLEENERLEKALQQLRIYDERLKRFNVKASYKEFN
jgi:hypothetical protein